MIKRHGINYDEFEAELLKKKGIRREYEALKPKYDIIKSSIERRNRLHISQTRLGRIIDIKQPAVSKLGKRDHNTTLRLDGTPDTRKP